MFFPAVRSSPKIPGKEPAGAPGLRMPTNWFNLDDPFARAIVIGAVAVIALALLGAFLARRREAKQAARRRAELRQHHGQLQLRQQEIDRLAVRIIATSSTPAIAGFTLVRQIEAVFTDGHPSPAKAVETLKALAAQKGANALINLDGERLPNGKCSARGDAVIVRPSETAGDAPQHAGHGGPP